MYKIRNNIQLTGLLIGPNSISLFKHKSNSTNKKEQRTETQCKRNSDIKPHVLV